MNRRLIIARHAKSSWKNNALSDHERPLNNRGRREAPVVAEAILEAGWKPDLVLSSDAQRTRETWAEFQRSFPEVECHFLSALYLADPGTISQAVASLSPDIHTAMFIGHNPGSSDYSSLLSAQPIELRTANAALLELDAATWARAALSRSWTLVTHLSPKDLDPRQL